jgi:hypothetical protein
MVDPNKDNLISLLSNDDYKELLALEVIEWSLRIRTCFLMQQANQQYRKTEEEQPTREVANRKT